MRFLVDMPLSPVLAQWLSDRGHDAVHATQRGLERADDATILRLAREEGAIVLTADLDYPRLLALTGSDGPGILLFRGGDWGEKEILERLEHTLAIVSEDELPHSILVIERRRIRRRRLPVTSQNDS
jgi:predicted nuclease of predicted toxin-antitoxin system